MSKEISENLSPKQELALDYYKNPESQTFGNLRQSLLKAGFSKNYADNIARKKTQWLNPNVKGDVQAIKSSEDNLRRLANFKIDLKNANKMQIDILKLQTDVSKFIVERMARGKYGKATGDNDKGNVSVVINNYGKAKGEGRKVRDIEAEATGEIEQATGDFPN